ncbi:MAG TPA: nicotinate phosphoribosyltransferase [Dehalococcoidia bacterium]|nr:nicotinate phosphoribosyltransferase [Dehalococcoidia bacterium]
MGWVSDANAALFTDLYELTMLQAYYREGMVEPAVFDLFVRELPEERNFLVAAGLDDALTYLERLSFSEDALSYLQSLGLFDDGFLRRLADFRFTGNVFAVPEGTPVFANEPLVEVEAPMPEAQFVETFLLNQVTFQTMIASKGARAVIAAGGRPVIDFGTRRTHGADAGLKAARALAIAGFASTSNVLAGHMYGLQVSGTMAHSYVSAHPTELDSFRAFARSYPETILLVDTYDTEEGVQNVIRLARELGESFRVTGVRLDSGDLTELSQRARRMLDAAGLSSVRIVVSGGLDEYSVARLMEAGAPIDSFAVGTAVGTSADAPRLDTAYKLVAYAGEGRMKLATAKRTLPGRKQVYRHRDGDGRIRRDVLALASEQLDGEPLLREVMRNGTRLAQGRSSLQDARELAERELAALPEELRSLTPARVPYPVELSAELQSATEALAQKLRIHH